MSKSKATKKSKATRIHDLMKEMATSFKLKADAETDTTLRQTYLDVFNIAQEQRKLLLKEVVFDKKHPKSALFYDRLKKTPYRGTGSNKMFPPGTEVLKIQTFEETLDEDTSFRFVKEDVAQVGLDFLDRNPNSVYLVLSGPDIVLLSQSEIPGYNKVFLLKEGGFDSL